MNQSYLAPLVTSLGFLISLQCQANSELFIKSIISTDFKTTTVTTSFKEDDYVKLNQKLSQELGTLLKSLPGIQEASFLSDSSAPFTLVSSNTDLVKRSRERALLIRFAPQLQLPESLFLISEVDNECKNPKLDQSTCPFSFSLTLTGPLYSYQNGFEGSRFEKNRSLDRLYNTFSIVFTADPLNRENTSAGTNLSVVLTLMDRSYQEFFRSLHEKGKLPKILVEKEIQGIFALSMQNALRDFSKKLSK